MKQPDPTIYVVATIAFAVLIFMPPSPAEEEALAMLVSGNSHFPWFLAIATLAGMPLAFAIPSLRASFMGRAWKVPSATYLIPRGVLRLLIGMIAGQALATLAFGTLARPSALLAPPAPLPSWRSLLHWRLATTEKTRQR